MTASKKLLICTFIILAISLFAGMLPIHGEGEIYDTVVRLHVLANSDSACDQALKLEVRDEVIASVSPALEGCKSQAEAIDKIEEIMPSIEARAEEKIREQGYGYSVKVLLGEEYYPTKTYETCAFPSGRYVSLRVLIGEGEGENWWCCLFPPLCLSAATDSSGSSNEEAFISVGLTGEQYKVVTETKNPKYRIRFKILETIGSWFS